MSIIQVLAHSDHQTDFIINNNTKMEQLISLKSLLSSVVYSFMGILILLISYVVIEKITPENLWKEIIEKKNVALAILASSFVLAIAIIIASAIHG